MADTGATLPGTGSNEDRDGKDAWLNPANIEAEANYATVIASNDYVDWLRASNFGFSVPPAATIDGIKLEISRNFFSGPIWDDSLRLVDNGSVNRGDDKGSATHWPAIQATATYGGASDMWGYAWTPTIVNSSNFGARLSAYCGGSFLIGYVHWIKITVYYTTAVAHEKSLSDSVAITDSLVKAVGLNKADTVAVADSIAKTAGLLKAETVAIADTIVKAVSLAKTDTVAIVDTFSRTVSYILALADTVTITDSISKAMSIVKADTMAITDAIVVGIGYALHIALSDIVTIKDRLVGELRIKTYLKQSIARMEVKGMDIARMSIKRMGIDRMPLFRWIIRRWTA